MIILNDKSQIRIIAPAKLNLFLDVTGLRGDGMHYIKSIVVPVSLCDEIVLTETDGDITLDIEITDGLPGADDLKNNSENLAVRAVEEVKNFTGCKKGVHIILKKNIPVGGGLGGGSVDAAAVILGLKRLWLDHMVAEDFSTILYRLGSDLPAAFRGKPVIVEGVGEKIKDLELHPVFLERDFCILLVNPRFSISTGDIYRRYRKVNNGGDICAMIRSLREGDKTGVVKNLYNALEQTVFYKFPLIELMRDSLLLAGAKGAIVTGTGSTVFGIFFSRETAIEAIEMIKEKIDMPLWFKVVNILPDGVMVAHGPLEA